MEYFIWNTDPTIFQFGSFGLRWYGLMFASSFFIGLAIMQRIYKREGKDPKSLDSFLIYIIVGTVIGARLMHTLVYDPEYYLANPIEILFVWKGGLASHGGMLGVILAIYIFAKKYNEDFFWLLSRTTIPGMLTAAFVRIGNFFNSEILGRPSEVPWAVVFSRVDLIPRHPVQLYEAFSYFIILGVLVCLYRKSSLEFANKILIGAFLFLLFSARFLLEYTKTEQADYMMAIPFTVGQILSAPFVLIGLVVIVWAFTTSSKDRRWQNTL
jgi:prolipoprotein diacylglyceryl transferase